jgi:hypothetical protein
MHTYDFLIAWLQKPFENLQDISNHQSDGKSIQDFSDTLGTFPSHFVTMTSWFYYIGLPQYAPQAILLSHFFLGIDAKLFILEHIPAPPEHKIKMLYELENLR